LIYYLACGIGASLLHLAVSYYQFDSVYQQLISAGFSDNEVRNAIDTAIIRSSSIVLSESLKQDFQILYNLYHTAAVGASGAIYGVLVAFAMLFPNFKIVLLFLPIPIAAKYFVPVLLLVDLTAGITGVSIFGFNIAHFAHIGGAIAGFLLVRFWLRQRP
jgi:membrane associated rhomboid family serine protease